MREATVAVLLGSLVLFASAPARADMVEFAIYRGDMDHDGNADVFFAEIDVDVPGATQVRMNTPAGWVSFDNGGGGEFWLDTSELPTLAALLGEISGPATLEITTPGNVSTYDFTITASDAAVNARFPTPIPEITGIAWDGNTATLSWDWTGGDPNAVDGVGVEVEAIDGNIWIDIYDKSTGDPPPNYLPKTALEANDIVFPAAPGTYGQIEFYTGYANVAEVSDGNGTIVTGWTHTGGDELFDDPNDRIIEVAVSGDAQIVPEPTTIALLSLGAVGLVRRLRRPADR